MQPKQKSPACNGNNSTANSMNTSSSDVGGASAYSDSFLGSSIVVDSAPGVASLDSPALQQSKAEIRSLASELAQLAHMPLESDEFYAGFLPRLCAAMGAKGAGVWRVNLLGNLELTAGHALPSTLLSEPSTAASELAQAPTSEAVLDSQFNAPFPHSAQPSEPHQRILQCAVAEGQPILVPPGHVKLAADRPTNPLSDAIIIIPIRPEENVEYLLEVVQRPSGGPAAQRGYLRFVAQMGDLMADYLRRQQLRQLSGERRRLERIETWLTTVAASRTHRQRQQAVADALLDLFTAERVILINHRWRGQVAAISGSRNFDPRSETVLAAQALYGQYRQLARSSQATLPGVGRPIWFQATNRRQSQPPRSDNDPSQPLSQICVDRLCDANACRQGALVPLGLNNYWCAIFAYGEEVTNPRSEFADEQAPQFRLLRTIGALLESDGGGDGWFGRVGILAMLGLAGSQTKQGNSETSTARSAQQWLLRAALVGLIGAIAFFPVSQPISATAILQPLSKQMYYAPTTGVVAEIFVDEGQAIDMGAPLLRMTSHELETEVENLQIEIKKKQRPN
jgi:hypothetical protein